MTINQPDSTNISFRDEPDRHVVRGNQNANLQQILIIDDDRKFSRLLQDYLKPSGFELHEAHDGLEGIRKLSEGHFDPLILALMLPGIDGIEVLRRLGPERQVP